MRRRRRFFALLFIFTAFATPLGFFYLTIVNESRGFTSSYERFKADDDLEPMKPKPEFENYSEAECSNFPADLETHYPECLKKMNWIRSGWTSHKCYAENYVDGSECSFRFYLSLVEHYCPPMEETKIEKTLARINISIRRLEHITEELPKYMKTRIARLWNKWKEGAHQVVEQHPDSMKNRRKLNILVFMGFLANEKKLKMSESSAHGGPLGELLQWSDLLATLSIIGHNLEVSGDKSGLKRIIDEYESRGPCQSVSGSPQKLDIIFTDIMGLNILKQRHRQFMINNKCRIRLLDSFGTQVEFTSKSYFIQNKRKLSGAFSQRNPWGGHDLNLRQHWTFYPHSDDNTFLGFVVDNEGVERKKLGRNSSALVYGKAQSMWSEAEKPLAVLKKIVDVHATVAELNLTDSKISAIFDGVHNHGLLNSEQLSKLLDETTIFFGLGFPLEGPAPLEAMAHGAVFINAKFREPKSRKNYKFLSEKPTLREYTSQNPYMEEVGEPFVITVDIDDEEELEKAIRRAIELKPTPKVPTEFTPAGMLLRVAMLLEKQEYCDVIALDKRWPPIKHAKFFKSYKAGDSCEMTCRRQNLLCEPSHFPIINSPTFLKQNLSCETVRLDSSPLAPFNCTSQRSAALFSCSSRPQEYHVVRLCPCRDFLPEQHALCTTCL